MNQAAKQTPEDLRVAGTPAPVATVVQRTATNSGSEPASEYGTMAEPERWTTEELFFSGDLFFGSVEAAIRNARTTIELESYIFDNDALARRIVVLLCDAARRGVSVRVIVDGIGSPGWVKRFGSELAEAGAEYKVYHELPWDRYARGCPPGEGRVRLQRFIRTVNRRNHRKLVVVDGETAWVGSMNVSAVHLESIMREKAWRDSGIRVQGPAVKDLLSSFEYIWRGHRGRRMMAKQLRREPASPLVLLNVTRRQRRDNYRSLLRRFREAKRRIWITSAYFLPRGKILRELVNAAKRGVDVRIIVPSVSDVRFMPWVALARSENLVLADISICEYLPRILHAKGIIVDDWMTIGSTNLNHRSFLHDLESDVVVTHPESKQALVEQFQRDQEASACIHSRWNRLDTWWKRLLGRVLLRFRYWM